MSKVLLAVDTATENCGVAIIEDGRVQAELSLYLGGTTHTKRILTAIDTVLSLSGVSLADIDAFAATRGPGSFTGLRIGISTMKGLAFATGKPVVGVSSLEVLAHQAGGDCTLVCPMIDARRNEIYWCIYRRKGDTLICLGDEQVGPIDNLADQIDDACMFIGNAAPSYASQLPRLVKHAIQWPPAIDNAIRPAVLAQLAWRRFQQGHVDDVRTFVPVYIRKSDAERMCTN
jgi:tRNA threonylcarbamoyladenosine biosynthesis protein TsaB